MLRLEVLDKDDVVISTHCLGEGLTLLGHSPGAHVHLSGGGVGPIHVGIQVKGNKPVVMDLGGPTRLKVDGKLSLEKELSNPTSTLEIGSRKVRLCTVEPTLLPLEKQR